MGRFIRSPTTLGVEALSAAAGRRRVRVLHLEARLLERVDEVEPGAREIQRALLVHDHAHAADLELVVARTDLVVEGELVAEARAAAADHLQAQAVRGALAFLVEQLADAL